MSREKIAKMKNARISPRGGIPFTLAILLKQGRRLGKNKKRSFVLLGRAFSAEVVLFWGKLHKPLARITKSPRLRYEPCWLIALRAVFLAEAKKVDELQTHRAHPSIWVISAHACLPNWRINSHYLRTYKDRKRGSHRALIDVHVGITRNSEDGTIRINPFPSFGVVAFPH